MCRLGWQKELYRCDSVKDLEAGDSPGFMWVKPSFTTRVLVRRKREGQREGRRRDDRRRVRGVRARLAGATPLAPRGRKGPRAEERGPPLAAGRGEDAHSRPGASTGSTALPTLGLGPRDPVSDFPNVNRFVLFEATKCVVVSYGGHGKLLRSPAPSLAHRPRRRLGPQGGHAGATGTCVQVPLRHPTPPVTRLRTSSFFLELLGRSFFFANDQAPGP